MRRHYAVSHGAVISLTIPAKQSPAEDYTWTRRITRLAGVLGTGPSRTMQTCA